MNVSATPCLAPGQHRTHAQSYLDHYHVGGLTGANAPSTLGIILHLSTSRVSCHQGPSHPRAIKQLPIHQALWHPHPSHQGSFDQHPAHQVPLDGLYPNHLANDRPSFRLTHRGTTKLPGGTRYRHLQRRQRLASPSSIPTQARVARVVGVTDQRTRWTMGWSEGKEHKATVAGRRYQSSSRLHPPPSCWILRCT